VTCDEDKEMVMGHVETYYERQRSISSIMSGGGEGEAVETCRKRKGTSLVSSKRLKAGGCRKRKACKACKAWPAFPKGTPSVVSSSSSSSSSSEDEDEDEDGESGSGEEAEIVDGTDVLEDEEGLTLRAKNESPGKVIPSSLTESDRIGRGVFGQE
jgi:hypothetical protein